ncbi:MAG: immunoglobulin domain-containing protein [Phycisphaeraceae bacterium]|nr:immunoglobulin domain-containing protein [Phycisphaeraceae bacterium]
MRTNRITRLGVVVVFGVAGGTATGGPPTFEGLGFLPGQTSSAANGVSGDGAVVVGSSPASGATYPFQWTAGGMSSLIPGCRGSAIAASHDGSAVVGYYTLAGGPCALPGGEGFYSNSTTGQSMAVAILLEGTSPDGIWWVGAGVGNSCYVCTTSTVITVPPPGGFVESMRSYGVTSSAGQPVVVGRMDSFTSGPTAYIWSNALGNLSLGPTTYSAYAITPDAGVVVGELRLGSSAGGGAFRWTMAGGAVPLGGASAWVARAVSADGAVIAGSTGGAMSQAYLWRQGHGSSPLAIVLTQVYGIDLTGWTLREARGVSGDGRSIVGTGINPLGQTEAFIVRGLCPQPAITTQPASKLVTPGATASLSVSATAGSETLTYQWRRNGVDLTDGGRISGALTPTLQISGAEAGDAGDYTVRIASSCAGTTSAVAVLTVGCPPVDIDENGVVEPSDIAIFVAYWNSDLANGTLRADYDHNGVIEPSDIAAFISDWFRAVQAGC